MTENHNDPRAESATKIVNTVTGYPEISYFISELLTNSDNMSNPENVVAMTGVKLWDTQDAVEGQPPTTNYEYLFDLEGADGGDPDANSLFNITTLQMLVDLGTATPNIIKNPELTYGVDFDINDIQYGNWTELQTNLGLPEVRQAYVIWLWMDTAYNQTFARVQSGGDTEIGILGTLGATAFNVTMNQMQLEFPMLTISEQLVQDISTVYGLDIDNATCNTIYTDTFKLTADQALELCANSTYFNFSSVFNTTVALTNTYLYKSIYNPDYYMDFINTLNISSSDDFDTMFYSTSSGINTMMESA